MSERWNPSGLYHVAVAIGCGGEMTASCWPECVTDKWSSDVVREDDAWSGWVVETSGGTREALQQGLELADKWFATKENA